jgi:mono/diheme cytochrome c family protein
MKLRIPRAVLIMAPLLATSGVRAQDIAAGNKMAHVWCSSCHLVDSQVRVGGNGVAPSFASIAQTNSTTEMSLAAFLSSPHAGMPNYVLNRSEILNVSTYILSLRKTR